MPDKSSNIFKQREKLFEKQQLSTEQRLLVIYKQTLEEIKKEISKMYERSIYPTITEERKFNRLMNLKKQIKEHINVLNRTASNTILSSIRNVFIEGYYGTGFAVEVGTGIDLGFSILNKDAITFAVEDNQWLEALKNRNSELVTNINFEIEQTLRQNAREEVVSGLTQGKSYPQISKAIKDRFDTTAGRAKRIANTETHKANSKGRVEGITRATESAKRLGLETEKIWRHNPGARVPRPEHIRMDGTPADENGVFTLPSGSKGEGPGLMDSLDENIYCGCSAEFRVKNLDQVELDPELQSMSYEEWSKDKVGV